ncbi:hypothetical protein RIF29_28861 [Crotalaria pallida]|uniref:Non-haem dioxygenase N-terminal domain-containing protein n=1 Tax=Crotalaria pallida TaxID=3830 RepID=A0AAN9EFU6_CROPI
MSLTLTPRTMPEINVDFRAPPPSPVASGRRSSVANDDVLSEFLESSLRVPDLVLPDKIFPKQRNLETPAKVDFVSLCFHEDEAVCDVVSDSMARIGCFQLVNHGIPRELMVSTAEAAEGIFDLPPGKRAAVTRSSEKPWGFEVYHAGEEEEMGSELSEEFVWCKDEELKLKMEGIWPIGYPNFSEKMKTLLSRIEKVAEKIHHVILKNLPIKFDSDADMIHQGHQLIDTLCCIFKYRGDNTIGRWTDSLKYDVIRMLIKGSDYSHSLGLHVCDGSSEFHIYSRKSWLSFRPEEGALIITGGDRTQILSGGYYKHVIGRPIFKGEKEDKTSMVFLYSTQNTKKNFQTNQKGTVSLGQQVILAIILNLVYHALIYVYRKH